MRRDAIIVNILLEKKANPSDCPDYLGWTPLILAAHYSYVEIVQNLLEHGVDIACLAQCGLNVF
jgi:ankyrin repeat protein